MKIEKELKVIREKAIRYFDNLSDNLINNENKKIIKFKSQIIEDETIKEGMGDRVRSLVFGIDKKGWVSCYYTLEYDDINNIEENFEIIDTYEIRLEDKEVENYLNGASIQFDDLNFIIDKFNKIMQM